MKVLHVIDSLGVGGGAEHSLASLLPLLEERGVTSAVATVRPRIGGLQARLTAAGFPVEPLPPTWPRRVAALRGRIRSEHPDLIHTTLFTSALTARLALAGTKIPSVDTLASPSYDPARLDSLGTEPWKLTLVRMLDMATVRRTTHIHAVNDAIAREAHDVLHIPDERISVIPRGRNEELLGSWSWQRRGRTRRRLGIAPSTPLVLNVGRQDRPKAQSDLVRAFARVLNEVPDAVLLIAGRPGGATDEVDRAVREVDVGDHIRLLGHRDDVADLYVAADVMAFPSLYEGAAGSIIEAMALRCPVVGSDAVDGVLGNGELGVVVRRGDTVALADAVSSLLRDPVRRRILADRGVAEFRHHHRIECVADATVDMYHRILDAERPRR